MKENLPPPEFGEVLPAAHPSPQAVKMLWLRRSTPADFLTEPGPDAATLETILTIAARAPDHRRVTPYRFVLFEGEARRRFGDALVEVYKTNEPDAEEARIECERNRFLRAPIVVAVISKVDRDHRTPEWEQVLTAGAVCQNMLLASSAHGFAAQWLTEWYAYDEGVLKALGLGEHERVAGFVYIGAATQEPNERARPALGDLITRY